MEQVPLQIAQELFAELDGRNPSFETIVKTIQANPTVLESKNGKDRNLLHCVLCNHGGDYFSRGHSPHLKPLVQLILELRPDMLRERDEFGCTPLHLAVYTFDPDAEVVQLLVQKGGNGMLMEADRDGDTPLHSALEANGHRLDIIELLLPREGWLYLLKRGNNHGNIPLHYAIIFSAPLDVVRYLLLKCPESMEARNKERAGAKTPFEIAKRAGSRAGFSELFNFMKIKLMVERNQEGLEDSDERGRNILHRVCANDRRYFTIDVLKLLLLREEGPRLARAKDCMLKLPLHHACSRRHHSIAIIKLLIETGGTETLRVSDSSGMVPLHHACCRPHLSIDILRLLMETGGPETLRKTDAHGMLPLHHASSGQTLAVVQLLVAAYPESEWIRDGQNRLPLDVARGASASMHNPVFRWYEDRERKALEKLSGIFKMFREMSCEQIEMCKQSHKDANPSNVNRPKRRSKTVAEGVLSRSKRLANAP